MNYYYRQKQQNPKLGFGLVVLVIAMGMGGELHYMFPGLGTIAMLDFVSYFVALPIIFTQWNKMGRFMHRSLIWAFWWTMAAMVANALNFVDAQYWLKCVSLASSSWAIMAASYIVLKRDAMLFLWYIVGAGIGGWIALYYFRNGAIEFAAAGRNFDYVGKVGTDTSLLVDKQVYPSIARGILQGLLLPIILVFKSFPLVVVLLLLSVSGFWLLFNGGSRSNFGMFEGSVIVGFAVAYLKQMFIRITKNKAFFIAISLIGIGVVFVMYKYLATSEMLGEGEMRKYESQFGEGGIGVVNGRSGFDYAIECALNKYGIGEGWHLRCHSVMANSLACEGVVGFLFWVYFYLECLWFVCKRLPYAGKYSAFIMLMILCACWDAFGSPFATRHRFFVLMSFIALCRDNINYGRNTVFTNMPWNRELTY